jgi:hypothetical protein
LDFFFNIYRVYEICEILKFRNEEYVDVALKLMEILSPTDLIEIKVLKELKGF